MVGGGGEASAASSSTAKMLVLTGEGPEEVTGAPTQMIDPKMEQLEERVFPVPFARKDILPVFCPGLFLSTEEVPRKIRGGYTKT